MHKTVSTRRSPDFLGMRLRLVTCTTSEKCGYNFAAPSLYVCTDSDIIKTFTNNAHVTVHIIQRSQDAAKHLGSTQFDLFDLAVHINYKLTNTHR